MVILNGRYWPAANIDYLKLPHLSKFLNDLKAILTFMYLINFLIKHLLVNNKRGHRMLRENIFMLILGHKSLGRRWYKCQCQLD